MNDPTATRNMRASLAEKHLQITIITKVDSFIRIHSSFSLARHTPDHTPQYNYSIVFIGANEWRDLNCPVIPRDLLIPFSCFF